MSRSVEDHKMTQGRPENASVVFEPRDTKKRKFSHHHHQSGYQTRSQPQQKGTARVRRKIVRPRLPRSIHWQIPKTPTDSESTSTTLSFAKSLLDKIWLRNKNQHRTQSWWKTLSMLRKALTRLSALKEEEGLLRSPAQASNAAISAQGVRKQFERETQIRRQKEIWTEWLREVLVPKAYLSFSGLVADLQFANLGVVLMGVLADVVSIVGAPKIVERNDDGQKDTKTTESRRDEGEFPSSKARSLMTTRVRVTGVQSGEIVKRQYDSDDLGEIVERETHKTNMASPSTDAAPGKSRAVEETIAGMESNTDGVSHAKRDVVEEGRTRVRGKMKRKPPSAIDDLFAGLT